MSEDAGEATDRLVDLVTRSLDPATVAPFVERVEDQADWLRTAIAEGRMDNADFAVGLEMEVYAVDAVLDADLDDSSHDGKVGTPSAPRLARVLEGVFDEPAASKELGLHNVEVNTEPTVFDDDGLAAQAEAIRSETAAARTAARAHDCDLVLDAMWTLPPAEGSASYLGTVADRDGITVAQNMRPAPRYVAIDNHCVDVTDGDAITLSVPGVEHSFPTILFESLATSIQPHLQVPRANAFPDYYNAAIRTLGPVLALASNSPFLPADLYGDDSGVGGGGDVDDPAALVDTTHHELRVAAFEQSVNTTPNPKVRVPRDIEDATAVVDRVVADDRVAPFFREWIEGEDSPQETLSDRVWEFDHKRGTYWRWLRCVVGGDPIDGANDEYSLRIEYRPIPTQPTVTDVVGVQALTVGLIRGLVAGDHPITTLPWDAAEASFYSAVEDGIDADLAWVTEDGERTADSETILGEVLAYARRGLRESGVGDAEIDRYLAPIEARVEAGVTPSVWKKDRVRAGLNDGLGLQDAIVEMQTEYIRRSLETDSFAEWL